MSRSFLAACALMAALSPALAQEADMHEGKGLIERGVELFMRGLFSELRPQLDDMATSMQDAVRELGPALEQLRALVDDAKNYEAPVRLPNGDILIRRKPDAPAPEPEGPQIEL